LNARGSVEFPETSVAETQIVFFTVPPICYTVFFVFVNLIVILLGELSSDTSHLKLLLSTEHLLFTKYISYIPTYLYKT